MSKSKKTENRFLLNFKTKNSLDINMDLILYSFTCINRCESIKKIQEIIKNNDISYSLERGIYEFSLLHITNLNLNYNLLQSVYNDKLYDLYCNLDIHDKKINNKTLLPTILEKNIDPHFVAFLSPEQLHPMRWNDIILKKQKTADTLNNLQTTDKYKCVKCGERKFKVTEIQLRSADEPMSRIHTCMCCGTTFIR
jgi:DNA-directed RNA polymerase subunit M/transcription elongation factor TFIIS